jgi:hypothetical protein
MKLVQIRINYLREFSINEDVIEAIPEIEDYTDE